MKRILLFGTIMISTLVVIFCVLTASVSHHGNTTTYRLYINGKEHTTNSDLRINHDRGYAELPLLLIMETLGADISREQGIIINTSKITISYNGYSFTFNTAEKNYGLERQYWMERCVRRTEGEELIVDSLSVSAMLYHAWGTDISIDYEDAVVYIDTLNASLLTPSDEDINQVNCRLIVNGTDITDGNYVYIDHENCTAELPVIAIAKALGADIQWLPCQPYPIKDRCLINVSFKDGCLELDTSKTNFGFVTNVDEAAGVRRVVGNDVIIDSASLSGLFFHGFKTNIRIDFDTSVVYIETRYEVTS